MKAKHIFIQPETDAALSKLGGANRAENLRRAVALAECADELAESLEKCKAAMKSVSEHWPALNDANHSLTNYRSAKQ